MRDNLWKDRRRVHTSAARMDNAHRIKQEKERLKGQFSND